jgi:hypothetical protein
VIYFPLKSCMVLFANATTSKRKSVSTKKVLDNNRTTQLAYLYTKRSEDKQTRVEQPEYAVHKYKVLERIRQFTHSGLTHIVRVHLVLPTAPKYPGFTPARISSCTRKIVYNNPQNLKEVQNFTFQEVSVDIDSNALQIAGLFSSQALENLIIPFPSTFMFIIYSHCFFSGVKSCTSWNYEEISTLAVDELSLRLPTTVKSQVKKRKQEADVVTPAERPTTFLCEGCLETRDLSEYHSAIGQCIYCAGQVDELIS